MWRAGGRWKKRRLAGVRVPLMMGCVAVEERAERESACDDGLRRGGGARGACKHSLECAARTKHTARTKQAARTKHAAHTKHTACTEHAARAKHATLP